MTGESAEPYREFISQMVLRLEHAGRAVNRELAGVRVEVAGLRGDVRDLTAGQQALKVGQDALREEMREQMRDLGEDSRAQTHALLRVLDRLEGGPEPAT